MSTLNETLKLAASRIAQLGLSYQGALTPRETWFLLQHAPGAQLVDVRTIAELDWVGRIPGAIEIEWLDYPGRHHNPHFLTELRHAVPVDAMLLFICRSGARSSSAAQLASEAGFTACYNVLEGFEGDRDAFGHRNTLGGWRAAGLPWVQA